nr:DMT family transporter [Anabaena sp. CA = ATCC 33047]
MLGYILGSMATIIMASLGIFVRNIPLNPQIITLGRFGFGFYFILMYLLITGKINQVKILKLSFSLVASGVFITLCIWLYINAINSTTLANAVFLLYIAPLIASGLAIFLNQEILTLTKSLLLGLALIGCLCIIEFNLTFNSLKSLGYLWGILSAIFYALFIVTNKQISQQIPPLIRSFWQLFFGTIAIAVIIYLSNTEIIIDFPIDLYWLIAVGFIYGFIALTLTISAIKLLDTYEYSIISYLEPLAATLLGWMIYSEKISGLQAVGCVIILLTGVMQIFLSSKT